MRMATPGSSHVTLVRPRLNANTCMIGSASADREGAFGLEPVDLRQAYQTAAAVHRGLPPLAEPGYRLFHVGGDAQSWIDLLARRDTFAVAGRHSCCDLLLDGDPEVALRHLLVRAEPGVDGAPPMLRILDLQTQLGFRFDQGDRESSAVVTGPLAVHVGRHALVEFPGQSSEVPPELPPMMVEPTGASPYRHRPANAPPPAGPRWTHVSLYGRAPSLHEVRSASSARSPGIDHDADGPPSARIALEKHGGGQSVEIADAELDMGVLIGRASKCDRRFARLLDDKVSRTHLLILRDEVETAAYDLASTNGTYLDGKRMRRFVLPDVGATLAIGLGGVKMHWHPPGG
jgi:hypothetical protein